jgi:hypothetical protein
VVAPRRDASFRVLRDGQALEQRSVVGHQHQARLDRGAGRTGPHRGAAEPDVAGQRRLQPGDGEQQGGRSR